MPRRRGPRGRETAAARSNERRSWYGYGQLTRIEKSRIGVALHDTTRVAAELTVFSLPVLVFVMDYPAAGWFDAKATASVALLAAILAGTAIRGGWIRPLATDTRGWVTLAPSLLVLRVPYYNALLALGVFGGLGVGDALGATDPTAATATVGVLVGLVWAAVVPLIGVLLFPRVAEEWLDRVAF